MNAADGSKFATIPPPYMVKHSFFEEIMIALQKMNIAVDVVIIITESRTKSIWSVYWEVHFIIAIVNM